MPLSLNVTIVQDTRKGASKRAGCIVIPNVYVRAMGKYDFKKSFYVKGHLDYFKYTMERLMPLGNGDYVLRLTPKLMAGCKKQVGDTVALRIDKDRRTHACPWELAQIIIEEQWAPSEHPLTQPKAKLNKFYEFIEKAATAEERMDRIALVMDAFRRQLTLEEMKRNARELKLLKRK